MPTVPDYSDQLRKRREQKDAQMRAAAIQIESTPEQHSEVIRLADSVKVTPEAVKLDPEYFKQQERVNKWGQMASESPLTAAWIASSNAAELVQDDLEPMGVIEKMWVGYTDVVARAPAEGFIGDGFGKALSGFGRLGETFGRATRSIPSPFPLMRPLEAVLMKYDTSPYELLGEQVKKVGDTLQEAGAYIGVPEERKNFATDVGGAIGQILAYAAVGPEGALVMGFGQGADIQASKIDASKEEVTDAQELLAMTGGGVVTGVTERLAFGWLMRRLPEGMQKALTKKIADIGLAFGGEAAQEIVENVAQSALAKIIYEPNAELFPWKDLAKDAGVAGTAAAIFRGMLHVKRGSKAAEDTGKEQLDLLVKAAGQTKARTLSPEKFKAFLSSLGDKSVYLPAEQAEKLFQGMSEEEVAQKLNVPLDDYLTALVTKSDVTISLPHYLTNLVEDHTGLREHLRIQREGLTDSEEDEESEGMSRANEIAKSFLAESGDNRIYEDVAKMLRQTGKYVDADVETNAKMIQAMMRSIAKSEGVDSWDHYQEFKPQIETEASQGIKSVSGHLETLIDDLKGDREVTKDTPDAVLQRMAEARTVEEEILARGIDLSLPTPEIARLLMGNPERKIDPNAMMDQPGYHGGPHRFKAERLVRMPDGSEQWIVGDVDKLPDVPEGAEVIRDAPMGRFRRSQELTGEGVAAFGAGHYLADRKAVAEYYRNTLAGWDIEYTTKEAEAEMKAATNYADRAWVGFREAAGEADGDPNMTVGMLEKFYIPETTDPDMRAAYQAMVRNLRSGGLKPKIVGQLYEVEIPDDGAYLLWDKPLSEQPEIAKKLGVPLRDMDAEVALIKRAKELGVDPSTMDDYAKQVAVLDDRRRDMTGQEFYSDLIEGGGQRAASDKLKQLGIPGIKYLDGSSRSKGEGNYNYVIFDDADIEITKTFYQGDAAVHNLQMVAERGERVIGNRSVISADERVSIRDSSEKVGVSIAEITRAVREHKLAHPVEQGWAPLVYNRTVAKDGKITHEYTVIPYGFSLDENGNQFVLGSPESARRVGAIAHAMMDEVRSIFRRAANGDKNAKNILAQAGWYKSMRSRIRQEFGGLGDLFADLLGATSPQTPVRDNWSNAIDALRRASRGDYDALIPVWEARVDEIDEMEVALRAYVNERMTEGEPVLAELESARAARDAYVETAKERGLTKKAATESDEFKALKARVQELTVESRRYSMAGISQLPEYTRQLQELKAARELTDDLIPAKESGKKYGVNGRNVVRAMVDLWRVVKNADPQIDRGGTAPKAITFSGNLIGFKERATIDVWAARMLQRLSGLPRIPSMAEGAVSGNMLESGKTTLQFGFGQDVFTEAVKQIRADTELNTDKTLGEVNDDDLQAVVWFIEKELWTVNNWTSAAGEGGSFELEASLAGSKDQARIKELRKVLDSSISPKATPAARAKKLAAKEAARIELAALERTVDRFVGGLSIQMSADTQGVGYVPTNSDMVELGNAIRLAVYEADNGNTVLGSKAFSTEGRYGGVERSLDLEVVAREGYNANSLWLEMLRQAQGAKQDSTFLSRVLRDNEDVDPLRHRPGVEIYFQTAAARAQLETVLSELAKEGVEFLTVIVDGRRSSGSMAGEMPAAVGVRLQYVPEFEQRYGMDDLSGLDDQALSDKINQKAADLDQLASRVSAAVEGVSFAGQFWYDTQVAFSHQYQEKIDAISTGTVEGETAETGSGLWSGESIRSGIESADRQARETTSTEPGGDVLGGDAQREVGQTYNQSLPATLEIDGKQRSTSVKSATGNTGQFDPNDPSILGQKKRGFIELTGSSSRITLLEKADASTFAHEAAHMYLNMMSIMASREGASERLKADYATLQKWMGAKGKLTVEQHEQFARGWEAYLFEGKSPSVEMAGVFQRFSLWLKAIYKNLLNLNVNLTDEVRAVMDRMIATDEEIAQARQTMGLGALIKEAASVGWSEAKFNAYQKAIADAEQAEQGRILHTALEEVSRTKRAWWKEQEAKVSAEVRAELSETPIYKALELLQGETKLDKGWLLNAFSQDFLNRNLLRRRIYQVDGGLNPDVVAEMFGFDSGHALVDSIVNTHSLDAAVKVETKRRMEAEHGNILNDGTMLEKAVAALHDNKRLAVLHVELDALAKLAGSEAMSQKQARAAAETIVSRQRVRDLNPYTLLRAERKAAGEALKHAGKQEWAQALAAKRRQVLNAHLYDVTQNAETEMAKAREYARKFDRTALRQRLGKAGWLDQVDVLLSRYELKNLSGVQIDKSSAARMAFAKAIDEGAVLAPASLRRRLLVDSAKVNWKNVPVDEMRGLVDALKQIEKKARDDLKMIVNGEMVDLQQAADEIATAIKDHGGNGEIPRGDRTPGERSSRLFSQLVNSWRRPGSIARILQGEEWGPITKRIINPIRDAVIDRLEPMLAKARDDITDLYSRHYTDEEMKENGKRFYDKALKRTVTRFDLLALAQHWGNMENRKAVLDGQLFGEQDVTAEQVIQSFNNNLDARDWKFVQGTWDYMNTYWPELEGSLKRRTGIAPPKVEADAFNITTKEGTTITVEGGYNPLRYDRRFEKNGQKGGKEDETSELFGRMMSGATAASMTKIGASIERVGSGKRPVVWSINGWHHHVEEVIRDIALSEAVISVDKTLRHPDVQAAMKKSGNTESLEAFDNWLKDVAVGELKPQGLEELAQKARGNLSLMGLGYNAYTAMIQTMGLFQSAVVVGKRRMAVAVSQYARSPRASVKKAMAESQFMRVRYELNAFNKDVQHVYDMASNVDVAAESATKMDKFIKVIRAIQLPPRLAAWAFFGIRTMQMQVDTITWMAGYDKGISKNMKHAEAVKYADNVVENSQTSGLFSDRSGVERGTIGDTTRQSEMVRALTIFGGPLMAKGNILSEKYVAAKGFTGMAGVTLDTAMLFIPEIIFAALIRGGWPDDDEEPMWLVGKVAEGMASTVPVIRGISGVVHGFGGGGSGLDAFTKATGGLIVQASQGEADIAMLKSLVSAYGLITGIPAAAINRALDYGYRTAKGDDTIPTEAVVGRYKD